MNGTMFNLSNRIISVFNMGLGYRSKRLEKIINILWNLFQCWPTCADNLFSWRKRGRLMNFWEHVKNRHAWIFINKKSRSIFINMSQTHGFLNDDLYGVHYMWCWIWRNNLIKLRIRQLSKCFFFIITEIHQYYSPSLIRRFYHYCGIRGQCLEFSHLLFSPSCRCVNRKNE